MSYVEPSFEIDHKGRVICQYHSKFAFFVKPRKTELEEELLERTLTCKTCEHYKQNDCFFPKHEIDKIDSDRSRGNFHCKLCGNKIHRILTIIQKFYVKEQYNIEMPLICCNCYEHIKDNNLLENFKKYVSDKKFNPIMSFEGLVILIMITILLLVFLPSIMFPFFIFFIAYWIFILTFYLYYYIKKLYYIKKGKKFYNQFAKK